MATPPPAPAQLFGEARRLARVQVWGRFKRAVIRLLIALSLWASPHHNPFLTKALRLEARRHRPLLTLAGLIGIIAVISWLWWAKVVPLINIRELVYTEGHLPAALGGNAIGFAGLLTAAFTAYGIVWVCCARAGGLLRGELFKSTLPQLQLLPISEERWLWMMSAQPAALAMLMGLAGMPVYLLAIFTGQWAPLDLPGLLLVFLMLGHIAPGWQPILWKQTAKGSARPDLKTQQALLRQLNEGVDLARMTPAQRMEHTRRVQRVMAGLDAVISSEPRPEEQPAKKSRKQESINRNELTKANFAGNNGWARGMMIYFFFNIFGQGMVRGGGPLRAVATQIGRAFPPEVSSLFLAFPISWPLMLARAIWVPLPFLSFALPPIALLLPLVVALRRQSNLTLASNVSAAETFWTTRRLRHRTSFRRWIGFLLIVLVFGYSWQSLIIDGEATNLLPGSLPTPGEALAALWTLTIVLGSLAAAWAAETHFNAAGRGELTIPEACSKALRAACHTFGIALLFYFGLCWLGGTFGGSPLWLERLAPTLVTGLTFCAACFASGAWVATTEGSFKGFCKFMRGLWLWALPFEALIRYFISLGGPPFTFAQAPHILLSPFVTLFALFRIELSSNGVAWWLGPLLQLMLTATFLSAAAPYIFARQGEGEGPGMPLWERMLNAVLLPFKKLYRFLLSIRIRPLILLLQFLERAYHGVVNFFKWCGAQLAKCDQAILARGERWDNPVFTAELRSRLRRQRWTAHWLLCVVGGLGILLLVGQPWSSLNGFWLPAGSPITSIPLADTITTGLPLNPSWVSFGMIVTYVCLAVAWISTMGIAVEIGRCFDRDRANGTLVFLFLTPMSNLSIVVGKILPVLIYGAGLISVVVIPLFTGVAIGLAGGSLVPLVVAAAASLTILAALFCSVSLNTMFAIRASKPGDGTSKALLCLMGLMFAIIAACMFVIPQFELTFGGYFVVLAILALIYCVLAGGAWFIALHSLRRQRNGDVTALGKGIA